MVSLCYKYTKKIYNFFQKLLKKYLLHEKQEMISIGLELQSPQLTLSLYNNTDGRIGYPLQDHRLSIGPYAIVYNDNISDKKLNKKLQLFIDSCSSKKWSGLVFTTDSKMTCTIPSLIDLQGLSNDAEFTFLHHSHRPRSSTIDMILVDLKKSLKSISDFLRAPQSISSVSAIRGGSSRLVRVSDFPFSSILTTADPGIVMLQKSQGTSFHVQATIGCPLEASLPILSGLIAQYKAIVPSSKHIHGIDNLEYIQTRDYFPKDDDPRIPTILALFLHYFLTYQSPKQAAFIVRHVFKDIVRSLTEPQYQRLHRLVRPFTTDLPVFRGADIFLEKLRTSGSKYQHQDKMIQVTNFPFVGTHILIEFRVIHPILANRLGLQWDDLIPLRV